MKIRILFVALLSATLAMAQLPEQDCIGAIFICSPEPVTYANELNGAGNVTNELSGNNSCTGVEQNSVWFKVYTKLDGVLSFTITPDIQSSADLDLDWVVYNLTDGSCQNLFSYNTTYVSCNYSSPEGTNSTGANGSTGVEFEPVIPVQSGEVYYIMVSRFAGISSSITIDFNGSTCLGNPQPFGFNSTLLPSLCEPNELNVYIDQSVQCIGFEHADFKLYNSNNQQIPIVNITKPECDNSFDYIKSFKLVLGQDLIIGQQYNLVKDGDVFVPCGEIDQTYAEITFDAQPFNFGTISFDINMDTCSQRVVVDAVFQDTLSTNTYSWLVPHGTSISPYQPFVSGLNDGEYTFSITTSTGCKASHTEFIDVFNYNQIDAVDIDFTGDTAYALPNFFQSYFWQLRTVNGAIQTTHTTYAPVNYIELSDFPIEYPCIVYVYGRDEYNCSKYYYIGYPVYLWADVNENPVFSSVVVNDNIIKVSFLNNINGQLTVYNMSGQALQSQLIKNSKAVQLDINSYAEGLYIINFTNTHGQTYSVKVVKMGY